MTILKRPIITEKTSLQQERGLNKYGFEVDLQATKEEIKGEVEQMYEVEVESVNTLVVRGKRRQRFTKKGVIKGKSSNYKKAIVTLKDGHEIDFYKHI
ncbi:MAG: 50S ribosomal protein L23 [Bacteroidia bacterium]|nr:50S ribosomal protein L23 [Bacteroidia bacterium]